MVVEVSKRGFTDFAESTLLMATTGHGRTSLSGFGHQGGGNYGCNRMFDCSNERNILTMKYYSLLQLLHITT